MRRARRVLWAQWAQGASGYGRSSNGSAIVAAMTMGNASNFLLYGSIYMRVYATWSVVTYLCQLIVSLDEGLFSSSYPSLEGFLLGDRPFHLRLYRMVKYSLSCVFNICGA